MTYNEVLDKVCAIVADKLDETVNPNTLLSDLNADSLDRAEIALSLGEKFSINISDADLDFIEYKPDSYQPDLSMFDLAKFVCKKKGIPVLQQTVIEPDYKRNVNTKGKTFTTLDQKIETLGKTIDQLQQDRMNRARVLIKQYPYAR